MFYKYAFQRKKLTFVIIALFVNLLLFVYFAFLQNSLPMDNKLNIKLEEIITPQDVTIVIREFEEFENSLLDDIIHYLNIIGKDTHVVIIADKQIYPPLNFNVTGNIKLITLDFNLNRHSDSLNIKNIIPTKFALFVQDGCRIQNVLDFMSLLSAFNSQVLVKAYAIQTGASKLSCPGIEIDRKRWTVKIEDFSGTEGLCDFVDGDQAILIKTADLQKLASPFSRPVSKSLYFQFTFKRWKTFVYKKVVFSPRKDFKEPMNEYQHKQLEKSRLAATYRKFGMRQIIFNRNKHEYIGCTKDTERCFGSVVNDVPDYIYEQKWTPPCCLKAIRETALHVFQILETNSVRYWLEGGSLLGAARHNDIIPWDYDVDLGIYEVDIPKCKELLKAKNGQYVDDDGFMWEKGIEGDFFRVHFSDINRNHIDIFPFYSKNGLMTKNTWFKTHRQDTEFPEHYLNPLTKILFIGRNVSAPNNIKDFLEYKFGIGVIENPKYPDSKLVY